LLFCAYTHKNDAKKGAPPPNKIHPITKTRTETNNPSPTTTETTQHNTNTTETTQHKHNQIQKKLRIYPNLELLPPTHQTRGMHTILRAAATPTADFAFYADRLARLLVEAGLGHLPFSEKTVVTPTGKGRCCCCLVLAFAGFAFWKGEGASQRVLFC
jgi:hypothetical protein